MANEFIARNGIIALNNTTVTGSLNVSNQLSIRSITSSTENTLILGPSPAGGTGEGGQILLQASGGLYTSASMVDNYQNLTRLLRGTNNGSDAVVASWDMNTKQMQIPAYNSTTAFTGSSVSMLSVDSNGYILTNGYTPYRYVNTTQSTTTGTLTETVVATATIAGGTFSSNDVMKMLFQATKGATTSNVTMRVKIGSTSTFASATTIATYSFTTSTGFVTMQRSFSLAGGNINCAAPTSTLLTDIFATSAALTAIAANPANALYLFFSVQLGTAGDSVTFTMANIIN